MSEEGTRFGRYRLVERLGAGGMAEVFRAVADGPEGFRRDVVVKRVLPEHGRDAKFVKMFLAEARLCALLHHPAIVQVFDLGEVDGEYFFAMEYVEGHDLASILRQAKRLERPVPVGLACQLACEIAQALAYAHALTDGDGRALEIVHRDVSPSNLMVASTGAIKLLDFGIAKAARRPGDERTRTGTVKGKAQYMSPEQADGRPLDARSDVFALGVVLYECLTLERPFSGDDELETLRLVREAKVWPPSSRRPELDPDVDALVLRLLAQRPEARFQSCDDVAEALRPLVHRHHADAAGWRAWVAALGPFAREEEAATRAGRSPPKNHSPGAYERTVTRSRGELQARPAPERRWLPLVGAAVVAAAGMAAAIWIRSAAPPRSEITKPVVAAQPASVGRVPEPALAPQVAAPPVPVPRVAAPTPAPAPARVRLIVDGTRGAEVLVDDRPVGRVPLSLELDRAAGTRAVVVRRAGYHPLATRVPADADARVDGALKRKHALAEPEIRDPFDE